MTAECPATGCRVRTYDDDPDAPLGCPGCADARDPDSGMTDDDAARWLAKLSRSPRYAGDGWRRLLTEEHSVEHAAAAARRNADPDQLPAVRAAADQLERRAKDGR